MMPALCSFGRSVYELDRSIYQPNRSIYQFSQQAHERKLVIGCYLCTGLAWAGVTRGARIRKIGVG